MRSARGLLARILTWENFLCAAHWAACGKRDRVATREFFRELDRNLADLMRETRKGDVELGEFTRFVIYDPKKREICAPAFRERVLHHALMKHCEPILDRRLLFDSYACRTGKGQQAAVARAARFAHRYPFFLKMDVRRFFDSVDHDRLKAQLAGIFRERELVDLLWRIIDSYETEPGKGLPIGSLMSQHFANSYLNPLDRYLQQHPAVLAYVRYMDDSVVWGRSSAELIEVQAGVESLLREALDLRLKDSAYINRTQAGMDFLGYRVFPDRIQLSRRSRQRFARKLRAYAEAFAGGDLSEADLQPRLQAICAFTRVARSWQFRRRVLERLQGEI